MNYWVVQELKGVIYMHGPYKSESARSNRWDKVQGGEVHKFDSFSSDIEEAKREFNDARVRGML